MKKWLGIHTGGAHYLDHLGVLCQGLGIPLLVTEQESFEVAKKFYPGVQVEYIEPAHLSLDFLSSSADVIFESGHRFALELLPILDLMYPKKIRVVYCPHGNSDKGYKKRQKARKDISLIYGGHMHRHLLTTGEASLTEKMVVTGNYRYAFYLDHQKWYDDQLQPWLKDLDQTRKNVFYAPSWCDGENSSSWISHCHRVIEEVGSCFNLLLRWHPFLDDLYPVEAEKIRHLCTEKPGIINLSNFPAIYPILNKTDFYLGDFSSIGYDALFLDKPLFFLKRHSKGKIYSCGTPLSKKEHWGRKIETFIDQTDWRKKRKELSEEVFGGQKSFEQIKKELTEALSQDRASWIV